MLKFSIKLIESFFPSKFERRTHWLDDHDVDNCMNCGEQFNFFRRMHHCRLCGNIYCNQCSPVRIHLPHLKCKIKMRICDSCFAFLKFQKQLDATPKITKVSEKSTPQIESPSKEEITSLPTSISTNLTSNTSYTSTINNSNSTKRTTVKFCSDSETQISFNYPSELISPSISML